MNTRNDLIEYRHFHNNLFQDIPISKNQTRTPNKIYNAFERIGTDLTLFTNPNDESDKSWILTVIDYFSR